MTTSLSALLAGLKARHSGPNSWSALCPSHEDRNPSLSISNNDGKILVCCHAGCTQESVINALKEMGLWSSHKNKMKPAQNEPSPPPKMGKTFSSLEEIIDFLGKGKEQAESTIYHYPGDWGVIRIDFAKNGEKKKLIRPFHSVHGGFGLGDPPGPRSLYSTRNMTVGKDDTVYVVEGEKCVDAMGQMGLPAVTSAHGSKSASKSDWTPLKGRNINIIPDNDGPGLMYAEEVRTILENLECYIQIINPYPTGSPEGFDVADWLEIENSDVIKGKILAAPARQEKEAVQNQNWDEDLMRSEKGNLKQNTHNLLLIIENDPDFSEIKFDEFTKITFIKGEKLETPALVRLAAAVEKKYSLPGALTERSLAPICETVGKKRPFHPIRDWLDALDWDGVPRVDHLFEEHYGASKGEYTRKVARNFMVGAVARIYKPGCKLDNMVVLEGGQGLNKSSSLKALFGEEFASEVKASPDSKDFEQALQGMWCLEFAELDSLQKADITRIKMQLSTQADWIRLPYKPAYQSFPRQSIFVGTTNDDGYLKDPTGSRRFWPVKCIQEVDIAGIRRDREQLFAEAVTRFKNGEKWWEVPPGAEEEQDLRYQHDVWEEYILPFLAGKEEITMAEIFGEECLNAKKYQSDRAMQTRVGNILKRHGWEKKRARTSSGRAYMYVPTSNVGTGRDNVGTASNRAIVPTVPTENGDLYREEGYGDGQKENRLSSQRGKREGNLVGTVGPVGTGQQDQSLTGVPTPDENVPTLDLNLFLREG